MNIYEAILKAAQAERHRRARRWPVSDALFAKAVVWRARKGIR